MFSLIVLIVGLASFGYSMDLAPVALQESNFSIFHHIVQSLHYLYAGKVQAILHRDLPDEFFATFTPHEKRMLSIIRDFYGQNNITSTASLNDIPLEKIIENGLLDRELPWESFNIQVRSTNLFVHSPNIVKYSPTATDSYDLYEQLEQIYGIANSLCEKKNHLDEIVIRNIFISGHLGGTAVAQLTAMTLQCDQDLGLESKGINVYSIGFGEYRVFSPKMIKKLDKISGFDRKHHLVFAGFERFFSPNFGSMERFGTVIDIDLELLFDGRQNLHSFLEEMRSISEDQFALLTERLTKKVVETSSPRIFARECPFALCSLLSGGITKPTFYQESVFNLPNETELESIYEYDWIHLQQVFITSIFMIEKMFKKYFHCLSRPEYQINLNIAASLRHDHLACEPYGEAMATIYSNSTKDAINFLFRIYPNLVNDSFWVLFGTLKIGRSRSINYSVDPQEKFRHQFANWCRFFQTQWSRISGPGAAMMKSLSPFFDESIIFPLGIEKSHASLLVDPEALMNIFLSKDPSTIKFVRDVFGPKKSEFYLNFKAAQRLIRTSSVDFSDSAGIISYMMPRNRPLLEVVQHLFRENEFRLQDLVELEGSLSIGSFSMKQILSFADHEFKTNVKFSDVWKKMQKPQYLYSCTTQISARHCPYMSLRKPNIPFWKRVMRVRDTYVAFIGSSAVHLPGNQTKLDLVMEHLGPAARPFVYKETGSFVVFEVYSKVKGFGPCAQQGMFYLMLVQDPKTLI